MMAGAATEMLGGTPSQVGHAVALTMQGTLGLVCDPLGGLVELPCVFRNATGSAIALAGIEMALAGITFAIPVDEVRDDPAGAAKRAIDILAGIGRHLGAGIGTLVNIFYPQLIVIGGGFAAAGDWLLDPAREILRREALAHAGEHVPVVRAELGTAAGLIGAGLVAFDAL